VVLADAAARSGLSRTRQVSASAPCQFEARQPQSLALRAERPSRHPESLSGLIERVTFFNEENGWAVLKVIARPSSPDPQTEPPEQNRVRLVFATYN